MKPPRRPARFLRRGFTLLEVMLAIAILVLITVTLYQFTETTLQAATFSQKLGAEDASLNGLRRLVSSQLAALPANQDSTLVGMSVVRGGGARRDALQLVCPAGNAVLSPDVRGYYQVTLDLREQPRGSGRYVLGLSREPWSDDDVEDEDETGSPTTASPLKATDLRPGRDSAHQVSDWVKLMDGVTGLEIDYFDARLNGYVPKWTDPRTLPNLVRLRLGVAGRAEPYEIIERVPGGGTQRAVLNPLTTLRGVPTATSNGVPAATSNGSQVPGSVAPRPVGATTVPAATPSTFRPVPIPGNTNPAFRN